MRISDWSSDVCSSDLPAAQAERRQVGPVGVQPRVERLGGRRRRGHEFSSLMASSRPPRVSGYMRSSISSCTIATDWVYFQNRSCTRSEEHTSELQSLMRISYAVFCLKKKKQTNTTNVSTPYTK